MPTQPAATLKRPESSALIATLKPSPTSPSSASSGAKTSSSAIAAVSDACRPILPWISEGWKPSWSVSTRKHATPRWRSSGSVWAKTSASFAWLPIEIHIFAPLIIQPPSTLRARVFWFAASLPVSGSVSPKQPSHSPAHSFGR